MVMIDDGCAGDEGDCDEDDADDDDGDVIEQ